MTLTEVKIGKPVNAPWVKRYNSRLVSADEAVKVIKSKDKLIIQPGCAAPSELINAMVRRKDELSEVEIYHILVVGDVPYTNLGMEKHFKHKAFLLAQTPVLPLMMGGRSSFQYFFLKLLCYLNAESFRQMLL